MHWLELILDFVARLAWPLVVAAGIVLFRGPISNFLERVKKAAGPGFELEAETLAQTAEKETRGISPERDVSDAQVLESAMARILKSSVSSRALFLDAWIDLEKEIRERTLREGLGPESSGGRERILGTVSSVQALLKNGSIDRSTAHAIIELNTIRNQLAHAELSRLSAEALADALVSMDRLKRSIEEG